MIGIIGGSGLYGIPGFEELGKRKITTTFGEPSDEYLLGMISGREVAFLARHSSEHTIPPHRLNYRANIEGFHLIGVKRIIAVNAVGGINPAFSPGDLVIPDQIIDFTTGRESTFYDGPDVVHVDFTNPYCGEMRDAFLKAASDIAVSLHDGGTYICTNGPRLETRAEIEFYRSAGGDIVGMTGMPEAVLAREREICYLSVSVVTNPAAGLTGRKLTTTEVVETMSASTDQLKKVLAKVVRELPAARSCPCRDALKEARL